MWKELRAKSVQDKERENEGLNEDLIGAA